MLRPNTLIATVLATTSLGLAGCGDKPRHPQPTDSAAQYLAERITHQACAPYDPSVEVVTPDVNVPAPLQVDGKYYSLTGSVEHPNLIRLQNFRVHHLDRYAGTEIVSRCGVVEINPISGSPAVDATLKNGEHMQLAVAYPIPNGN